MLTFDTIAAGLLQALKPAVPVPIHIGVPPASLAGEPHDCPMYELIPRSGQVTVNFQLPKARAKDIELYWDRALHSLDLTVQPRGQEKRLAATVSFTTDVNGASGSAALRDGVLCVRLPREDVDTLTGICVPAWGLRPCFAVQST